MYGTAASLVIPIPEIEEVTTAYRRLYEVEGGYRPPRQYIHVQRKRYELCWFFISILTFFYVRFRLCTRVRLTAFGMDQEIPDYDMDSADEDWLNSQPRKLDVTSLKFETMMDRLEKGSGQTVGVKWRNVLQDDYLVLYRID